MIITRLKARIEKLREEMKEQHDQRAPELYELSIEGKIDELNKVVAMLEHEGKTSFHTVTWSERDGGVEVKIALINPDGVSRGLNLLVGDHFLVATYPGDQFMAKHLRRDDLYEGESGRDRDRIMGQIQAMIKDVAERLFPMQGKYDELDQADKEEVRYLERHMDELRRTLDVFAPPTTPYVMKNQDDLSGMTLIAAGPPMITPKTKEQIKAALAVEGSIPDAPYPERCIPPEEGLYSAEAKFSMAAALVESELGSGTLPKEDVPHLIEVCQNLLRALTPPPKAGSGCQRCGVAAVAHATAKCSDLFHFTWPGGKEHDGYVLPHDLVGLRPHGASHDYVELEYCLSCGQIQGSWPTRGAARSLKAALTRGLAKSGLKMWCIIASWKDGHWTSSYFRARSKEELDRYVAKHEMFRMAVSTTTKEIADDPDEIPPDAEIITVVL